MKLEFHFFSCGVASVDASINRCINSATQSTIGSGAETQPQMVFGKYLIEWGSFSSAVYYVRKTAQETLNKLMRF